MPKTLVVIDIQNEYFDGGLLPLWKAEETEAQVLDMMRAAQDNGGQVVLIRHESKANAGLFAKGGQGSEIRKRVLDAAPDAPVVTKHVADAFQDTDLAVHLGDDDELLVCGMMTQNCVVFTALSAAASNRPIRVLGDLCTAPTEIVHKIALNALGSKLTVCTAAEVDWDAQRCIGP